MKSREKLNFIMNITKTSNSSLARQISLDASHISRLRRGERRLVANADYIEKMMLFFVEQCIEDYQKNALSEAMGETATLFNDLDEAAEHLYIWLFLEDKTESASVAEFLDGLRNTKLDSLNNYVEIKTPEEKLKTESSTSLYYGPEGKRKAVIRFLSIALEKDVPGEIYLYSDESMDWINDDKAFKEAWMHLMFEIILKGNRIKIIHNVNRNLNEMIEALSKWIPLYMTGAIEPYYYPKKRDGIFRRTMFAAPGNIALSATSLDNMDDKVLNVLYREKDAVDSVAEEFNHYLSLCKPLMKIYTDTSSDEYIRLLSIFEKKIENTVLKTEGLTLATMPKSLIRSMIGRADTKDKDRLMKIFMQKRKSFLKLIKEKEFNEIIGIDDLDKILEGKVEIENAGIKSLHGLKYTVEEYIEHLKNIVSLLKTYENYSIAFNKGNYDEYRLYVKEDFGVIVDKITEPHVAFAIKEDNMTASFWDFMNDVLKERMICKINAINRLEALIRELRTKATSK